MRRASEQPQRTCRSLLIGAVALAGLATVPAHAQQLLTFTARLQSGQETPPNLESNAFGSAFFTIDTTSNLLCYSISYSDGGLPELGSGETATGIHGPAAPGEDAPGIFFITPGPSPAGSPKQGCTVSVTPAQRADFIAGLYYVNVHSNDYPQGEIRGQILFQRGIPLN